MNFSDRKTQIIIGAGVAAAAIIILVVVVVVGRRKAAVAPGTGGFGVPAQTAQAGGALPQPGALPAVGAVAPGAGGAIAPTANPAQAPRLGVIKLSSGEASVTTRVDPFITFDQPPLGVLPEQRAVLPLVNLQPGGIRPAGAEAARVSETVANRRVAGLKFGEGAWAILEKDGQSFVVKPGETVEGTKILAISRDSVLVRDANGQRWRVPLRGGGGTVPTQRTTAAGPGGGSAAAAQQF